MRPFDNPSEFSKPASVLGSTLRDHRLDATIAKFSAMRFGVVAAIGIEDLGLLKGATTHAANRWNRVDERQQLGDVVAVRAAQDRHDGNAVGIDKDVMLGAWSRAIRGVRARFSPAPTARTDDESTATREKSISPASRSLASSSSCSRSHTPVSCQSFNRRQQVAPEPKPNRVGKWFQRIPVLSTNRMPFSAARFDTGRRPGFFLRRGFAGGSNGSISVHNSSSAIGASIPWVPLFRSPRLTVRRESKQPHLGLFELAS